MLLKFTTLSDKDTEAVGKKLALILEENQITEAFIALFGEMGVGKTAFTRGFASHFGISSVKSPTYTVVNEHTGRAKIHHFDFYRILSDDDLYSIGYDDIIETGGYTLGEWCENILPYLPQSRVEVTIKKPEGTREVAPDAREIEINFGSISERIKQNDDYTCI